MEIKSKHLFKSNVFGFCKVFDERGSMQETGEMQSNVVKSLIVGDVDGDGDIDIFDVVLAAGNYGESW